MSRIAGVGVLFALNGLLALAVHAAAPATPRHSDRQAYEYVGQHPLEPNCGWSIYCYRVLVPALLARLPGDSERRWRCYQAVATTAAGTLTSLTMRSVGGGPWAAVYAAILAQTSYGFSFTAYDPYTADPLVFVFAAAIGWSWLADRWRLALLLGIVGIFVKETVALVSASCLLAALLRDRRTWRQWVVSSASVGVALLTFRQVMDTYFGWGVSANPAAQFSTGSWIVVWWQNNPFLIRKLYLLFAPFGFAWLFAAFALRHSDPPLRHLAFAAIAPFIALCYVQTPERALSNAFFVAVPLASLFLARAPRRWALAMAVLNGIITAKIGSSTPWLPPSGLVMIPASVLAVWLTYRVGSGGGIVRETVQVRATTADRMEERSS